MFNLFNVQVFISVIKILKKINLQLRIYAYGLLNKPIYYLVIFVFEHFIGGFLLHFLLSFKKYERVTLNIFFNLYIEKPYIIKIRYI